jgi:hypothetical protein
VWLLDFISYHTRTSQLTQCPITSLHIVITYTSILASYVITPHCFYFAVYDLQSFFFNSLFIFYIPPYYPAPVRSSLLEYLVYADLIAWLPSLILLNICASLAALRDDHLGSGDAVLCAIALNRG